MVWKVLPYILFVIGFIVFTNKTNEIIRIINRMRRDMKGGDNMTKLIKELVGKQCKMYVLADLNFIEATVLEVDEEWIKVLKSQKKGKNTIQIFRIDDIGEIEVIE